MVHVYLTRMCILLLFSSVFIVSMIVPMVTEWWHYWKKNLLLIFLRKRKNSCGFTLMPGINSFLKNSSIPPSLLCATIVMYAKSLCVKITIQFCNYCFIWLSFKLVKREFYWDCFFFISAYVIIFIVLFISSRIFWVFILFPFLSVWNMSFSISC